MLDKTAARVGATDQVVGDKGFDGERQREACRARGAAPVIPAKSNRVERLFGKLKEFRRVATRYDKKKRMFLGWLHLVLGFIRLRARTNVNRA
jgi:transposase